MEEKKKKDRLTLRLESAQTFRDRDSAKLKLLEMKEGKRKLTAKEQREEVAVLARAFLSDPDYKAELHSRLMQGKAKHIETLLWHYAYGKPADNIKIDAKMTLEQLVIGARKLNELPTGSAQAG